MYEDFEMAQLAALAEAEAICWPTLAGVDYLTSHSLSDAVEDGGNG